MTAKRIAFATSAALLSATIATSAWADMNATCKAYAISAVKQQQANLKKKCGQTGKLWSANLSDHVNYCKSNSPETWRSAAESRAKALATCK